MKNWLRKTSVAVIAFSLLSSNFLIYAEDIAAVNPEGKEAILQAERFPVLEIKEEGAKITYEEALKRALKNSSDLKKLAEDIKITEEKKENASSVIVVERPPGYGAPRTDVFISDATHISDLVNLVSLDIGREASEYQKEIKQTLIEYQVKTAINNIIQLKKDIELAKRSLEISNKKLSITKQKAYLGLESKTNETQEIQKYEQQQKQLDSLYKNLDNQYISFNRLIGAEDDERFILDYDVSFELLGDIPLDSYVLQAINKDPSIHIQEGVVKQAEYNLNLYSYTGGNDSYSIRKSRLEQAMIDLNDAKNKLKDNIRNAYNRLHQIEKEYEVKQLELEKAIQQWKVAKTKYDLGMIIETDLKQAELAVLNAQADLEKTISQYDLLKFAFQHPYLLSSNS
ncbi:MAG: hypothetical protein PWP07_123 [Epulopiscium sp.]|nr:hypothetical protein [Candidatus Epulonipiscium sp.]